MSTMESIKAKLLREAIKARTGDLGTKPGILSVIYPATKHGPNGVQTCALPISSPEVGDHGAENEGDKEIEENPGAEAHKPPAPGDWAMSLPWPGGVRGKWMGKSYRTTSPNQQEAKDSKPTAAKNEEKHQTTPFVQRCVAAITGGAPASKDDLSGAFAKCNATKNKSDKPLDSNAIHRPGYMADKAKFVKAISAFKGKSASGYD